jgi:branched-chain amino acid transport system substrate-binding protein
MNSKLTRGAFVKSGAAIVAMPAIVTRPGWAATGPIKIGAVEPLTGPAQLYGKQDVMGLEFAIEKINKAGGLFGRELKSVVADYESKNDLGTRRARELLLDEKVDTISAFGGAVALVCSQLAAQQKKLFVTPQAVPAELAESAFQPTTFMCSMSTASFARAMAYVAAKSPLKRVYQFQPDNANGRTCAEFFRRRFNEIKRPDQEIVAEEFFPTFNVSDFSPYVTKIDSGGPGLVISVAYGSDIRNLIAQGHSLGWKQKLLNWSLADPTMCRAVGDAIIGHIQVQQYMLTIQNPINDQFIKEWTARYQTDDLFLKYPEQSGGKIVATWLWYFDVLRKAGTVASEAVIAAFENSSFDSPFGKISMRACDHQVEAPAYYSEFRKSSDIPEALRFFGDAFPYLGAAELAPLEEVVVPQNEVNNPRCKA